MYVVVALLRARIQQRATSNEMMTTTTMQDLYSPIRFGHFLDLLSIEFWSKAKNLIDAMNGKWVRVCVCVDEQIIIERWSQKQINASIECLNQINAAMLLGELMMVMLHMDPEWLTTKKFVYLFWSCVMLCVYLAVAVAVVHFAPQNSWIHSIHSLFYALAFTIPALCSPIFRIERFYANSFRLRSKFPSLFACKW